MKIILEFDEEYAPDMGAMLVKFGREIPMEIKIKGESDEVFDLADFLESHNIYPKNVELDKLPF